MTRGPLAATALAASLIVCAHVALAGDTGSSSGFSGTPRVTNGVTAHDLYTTGVFLSTLGSSHEVSCSGTLVGCRTFLTAAHCVCEGSSYALCGTPALNRHSVYLQDVGIVPISGIDVDPTYDFEVRGDVAVITLATPVTGVSPTPINSSMRPPFGTQVEIAGYGLTQAGAGDTGMLRQGLAETSACTTADGDYHVCWDFTHPLGPAGLDSNTCNGDSGGPLFADLGAGTTLVGITSGGNSADCLPADNSYDTDVFVHRSFIQGVAGADLLNTTCGSIAQVGDPGVSRTIFDYDAFTKQQQSCRKEIARAYTGYVTSALRAWQSCLSDVNAGDRPGPCPDQQTLEEIAAASEKVSVRKLGPKCPVGVTPTVDLAGACAGATTANDLVACLLPAGDDSVADFLDLEYADDNPSGAIADEDAARCQRTIARSAAKLVKTTIRAATRCQAAMAAGKSVFACPDDKMQEKLTDARDDFAGAVLDDCSDDSVVLLDSSGTFGGSCGGQATALDFVNCELDEHTAVREALVALLGDRPIVTDVSFEVPAGKALLRVTLNGKEGAFNDLDMYVRAGAPATEIDWDARSENAGMFEEAEFASPAAGTWHVHLKRFAGETLIPYQLTATAFDP